VSRRRWHNPVLSNPDPEPAVQSHFTEHSTSDTRFVRFLTARELGGWLSNATEAQRAWIADSGFRAKAGSLCLLPGPDGKLEGALVGIPKTGGGLREAAAAAARLPSGEYRLEPEGVASAELCAMGWSIGQYRFGRYLKGEGKAPRTLVWPEGVNRDTVIRAAAADRLVRDLVNTPTADMGPLEMENAARVLAEEFGADIHVTVGEALLDENFPAIHAVGRASDNPPRLVDITWGDADHPKVTLVGKGVCFDSGGLNIKSGVGMRLMKKDMGGAAHVLGLARLVMGAGLPVRLRVLVAAVENSISGNAYRPGDVITTRKGITVEIANTDAEGRMVLCDALALADEEKPDLIVDMATLTGAARVALGPELPAMYSDDDDLARQLVDVCMAEEDAVWHMPLWKPYERGLSSAIADMNHIAGGPMAGSIYAALYLKRFVENAGSFLHLDIYAWNAKSRPGRPEGAECQSVRGLFRLLQARF
jgi:leucyl aminopeptidase